MYLDTKVQSINFLSALAWQADTRDTTDHRAGEQKQAQMLLHSCLPETAGDTGLGETLLFKTQSTNHCLSSAYKPKRAAGHIQVQSTTPVPGAQEEAPQWTSLGHWQESFSLQKKCSTQVLGFGPVSMMQMLMAGNRSLSRGKCRLWDQWVSLAAGSSEGENEMH